MDIGQINTSAQSTGGLASPLRGEGQAADKRALGLQVYFAPIGIGYRAGHPPPLPDLSDLPAARAHA